MHSLTSADAQRRKVDFSFHHSRYYPWTSHFRLLLSALHWCSSLLSTNNIGFLGEILLCAETSEAQYCWIRQNNISNSATDATAMLCYTEIGSKHPHMFALPDAAHLSCTRKLNRVAIKEKPPRQGCRLMAQSSGTRSVCAKGQPCQTTPKEVCTQPWHVFSQKGIMCTHGYNVRFYNEWIAINKVLVLWAQVLGFIVKYLLYHAQWWYTHDTKVSLLWYHCLIS